MNLKNKIAIGCLVQWYEIEMIEEYLTSIKNAVNEVKNREVSSESTSDTFFVNI